MSDAIKIIQATKEVLQLKQSVQDSVDAIKSYRTQQKKLYRDYYTSRDALANYIGKHKDDNSLYEILKSMSEVDADDIFYARKKQMIDLTKD